MKQRVYVLIALIPLIVAWLLILSNDPTRINREPSTPAPKWVGDVPPVTYYNCDQAIIGTPSTKPVTIDSDRAARIGAGVIQSQTDLLTLTEDRSRDFTPILVERQFPDNQSHITWVYGELRRTQYELEAKVEIVYIDAMTGDPLMLLKDITVYDPSFTCKPYNLDNVHYQKIVQQVIVHAVAVVITAIYALVALIIAVRSYRRRVASSTPVS